MRKRDIVARALRRLGVVAYDAAPDAAMVQTGLESYEQVLADLNSPWGGCLLPFSLEDEVPTEYRRAIVDLLAFRLAPDFERPPPLPEITALMRIRAVNQPYVRCETTYCCDYGLVLPCGCAGECTCSGVILNGDPVTGFVINE